MSTAVSHLVYRLYGEGNRLLYVGITLDWTSRKRHHAAVQPWFVEVKRVELESWPDRDTALVQEAALIRELRPPYNDQNKPTVGTSPPVELEGEDARYVGTVEAARITGMSHQSIRRLCAAGAITCQKVGHDWIIRRGALHGVTSKRPGTGRPRATPREEAE